MKDAIKLRKNLRTIGNSTFIKYFHQFKSDFVSPNSIDFNSLFQNQKWSDASKRMKVDAGRRIFKKEYEKLALEIVLSARNDELTTDLAAQTFSSLYPNETLKTIRFIRPEFVFDEEIIQNLFAGYSIDKQFPVGNYNIDWYIKELNLAIEFDDRHHNRNTDADTRRQQFIENALGCKFLRYKL